MPSCRLGPECETPVGEVCKDPLCENSRSTYVEQVGGDHYRSEYHHWDWAVDVKLPYLEGNATKYISRARSSKGEELKDLRKGLSYIEKMLKCYDSERVLPVTHVVLLEATQRFAKANGLTSTEYHVCLNIAGWQTRVVLHTARTLVAQLIQQAEAKSVPLTDSNKHASQE